MINKETFVSAFTKLSRLAANPSRKPRDTHGRIPLRTLPLPDAVNRLKNGLGSVPLPAEVKGLELRYYRRNCSPGIIEFIAQRAPEIAYANPYIPLSIVRLGKPVAVDFEERHRTRRERRIAQREKRRALKAAQAENTAPPEPTPEEREEQAKQREERLSRVVSHKEDGTPLTAGDRLPVEITIQYQAREAETIQVHHEDSTEILKKILAAVNMELPERLSGPEATPRIAAPPTSSTESGSASTSNEPSAATNPAALAEPIAA